MIILFIYLHLSCVDLYFIYAVKSLRIEKIAVLFARHIKFIRKGICQNSFNAVISYSLLLGVLFISQINQSRSGQISSANICPVQSSGEYIDTSVAELYQYPPEDWNRFDRLRFDSHCMQLLEADQGMESSRTGIENTDRRSPYTLQSPAAEKRIPEQVSGAEKYLAMAGEFFSNSPEPGIVTKTVYGLGQDAADDGIRQFLNHFGTARVHLGWDKNLSLKNSQFDLLMPLYDQGDNLVFTQGSLHRTDSRTQANLGAGWRYFSPLYMLGGNLFGDYDLSRDHARMGAGVEYWRDFLKLGANGYLRLTDWKDSPALENYRERPASGWDIRAQAWVPSLPQLGGKLTYEQYYGKEVALFGVDNRQKSPHAITAGINYTPVPLITLGAEQRQGQPGKSDTRLTMDMNYQFGVPWRTLVDPTAVAGMRSLTGSRYDLVERNNNIVLEYRRKEVLRLHTAGLVTGKAGEQKSLQVSVTSSYGLSHIDWEASALNAAGGKIVQNGADYAVVLPAYQTTVHAVNTYTVSGVAVDRKGNRSERSDTQVTVLAPEVNRQNSTFTPASSVLPADGKSTQVLTLALRDENNQALDIGVKDISLKSSALKSASVSALTRQSAGMYTVTVTAGTDVETVSLTPAVSGITLSSAVVTVNSVTPDAGQSQFSANPETIIADNTATSTLTLVVKDAQGDPLTGLKDHLTFTVKDSNGKTPASGVITESAITESAIKGIYTATLKGTTTEKYTIVPEYNGTVMGRLSASVIMTYSSPDRMYSSVSTDKVSYIPGDDIKVTVMLRDATNKPVSGAKAVLEGEGVQVENATPKGTTGWTDNNDGIYNSLYTAKKTGTSLKAILKLKGWGSAVLSEPYEISPGTEMAESVNTQLNAHNYPADGTFPTTGFTGATFTIIPKNNVSASDYIWTTNAAWVSVTSGVVKFTGKGDGNKVVITGRLKSGPGKNIEYSFRLNGWFINKGSTWLSWSDANTYCSSQSGYRLATVEQIIGSTALPFGTRGDAGGLWSEWGSLSRYPGANFPGFNVWSSDEDGMDYHYSVNLDGGYVFSTVDDHLYTGIVCRTGLSP